MANGDDGYVDTGGGGSVWWKLRVSEGHQFGTTLDEHVDMARATGKAAYLLSGHDSYAEEGKVVDGAAGYYVVTIADASQARIVAAGNTLRVYLPVQEQAPALPDDERDIQHADGRVPQIRVRWGVRRLAAVGMTWAAFSKAINT